VIGVSRVIALLCQSNGVMDRTPSRLDGVAQVLRFAQLQLQT
jgi:hypothetical protein